MGSTKTTYLHFEVLDSTQAFSEQADQIKRLKENSWLVVSAEHQKAGRGTHKRPWISPPGNLYATLSTLVPETLNLLHIPQVVAYSLVQVLKTFGLENLSIKWVNDVLVHEQKIAGILCNASPFKAKTGLKSLHIGVGINIHMDPKYCDEITQPATSMALLLPHKKIKVQEVLIALEQTIDKSLKHLMESGFDYFLKEISALLAYRNKKIVFDPEPVHSESKRIIVGKLLGLTSNGQLKLGLADGKEAVFFSGRILRGEALEPYQHLLFG